MGLKSRRLMLGNEAIARGAWEAGVRVSTAYPGTPSTEITKFISAYPEVDSEWSVNEKVALEVAMGAAIAGARSMVSMKHVGLNVAMDPLMSISYAGVNAGLVIVVADDPGLHSSQNEQDTRYFGIAAKVPVLEPSDSQECRDFMIEAFRISEAFDTPVIVRLTTRISHSQSIVTEGERADVPLRPHDARADKYVVAPLFARKRRVLVEQRLRDLEEFAESSPLNRVIEGPSGVGVVSNGSAYQCAREVFEEASFFKLGMTHPLPRQRLTEFAESCEEVIVVEELEPIIEEKLRSWGLDVVGKEKVPIIGELNTEIVRKALTGEVRCQSGFDSMPELPERPPILCAGCHHHGPFYVMKKLKLHVAGDIGCYTLAAFEPLNAIDSAICMGAGIGMALGFQKARGREFAKETVAVIGDSTFWHSGITGLIDVVYNRGVGTVVILDNSVTAMTGHQDNPSTGATLQGEAVPALDFIALAHAVGVKHAYEVSAFDLKALEEVIRRETQRDEPSVIVTKGACVLKHGLVCDRRAYRVKADMCTGCRQCMGIGCPAIHVPNTHAVIDEALCTGCSVCAQICPQEAILQAEGTVAL